MRKLLYVLLAAVLAVSLLAIPAYADGSADLTVTTNGVTTVRPDGYVTFTIQLNNPNAYTIKAIQFTLTYPEGLEYDANDPGCKNTLPLMGVNFNSDPTGGYPNEANRVTYAGGTGISSESFDVMTITLKAKRDADTNDVQKLKVNIGEISADGHERFITGSKESNEDLKVVHTDLSDHTPGGTQDDPAATCTQDGIRKTTCQYCHQVYKEDPIDALGHQITFYGNNSGGDENQIQWTDGATPQDIPTAKVWVYCANPNCPNEYNVVNGQETTLQVTEIDEGKNPPTCTSGGSIQYTASISIHDEKHDTGAWTLTSDPHTVTAEKGLGHTWEEKNIDWSAWTDDNIERPFTATLKCSKCEETMKTDLITPTKQTTQPGCTKPGKDVYTATANFTGKDPYSATVSAPVPTNAQQTKEKEISALGHKWSNPEFTWTVDAANKTGTATVKFKCERDTCDAGYDKEQTVAATVERTNLVEPACETEGTATCTATYTTPGNQEGTNAPREYKDENYPVTLPKLGHNYANPVVDWQGTNADDNNYNGTKVIWTCTNNTDHTKEVEAEVTPATELATYSAPGAKTWTVKVTSDKLANIKDPDKITPNEFTGTTDNGGVKTEEIPMLVPESTINETQSVADVTAPAKDDLPLTADVVKQMVEDAIKGSDTGLSSDLETVLKNQAAISTTDGLTVTTNLVIEDKNETPAVTIPNLGSDTTIKDVYDIHIDVTVNGGGLSSQVGHIEQTAAAIPFTVTKPADGGPIYVVMRYHGDKWEVIPSTTADKISFSSNLFSEFAILSSSDLKYATIEPIPDQTYTGSAIQPKLKVTINGGTELVEGEDYVVEYANNVNVGSKTATATIKPADDSDYSGEQTVSFSIAAKAAAASSNTSKTAPATGDETPVALYAGILTLSVSALAVVCIRRKKTH